MINFEKAEEFFKEYLKNFDCTEGKTKLKIIHTYKVLEQSERIAKDLNLPNEDIELAKLIGLLHDIGRFEQAKRFNDFRDYETGKNNFDHAVFGCDLLFKQNLIRSFIDEDKFDNIIYKSILNHNRLKIEEGLTERELLHSKIIRDADKADNFRVKQEEEIETLLYMSSNLEQIENEIITPIVYEQFMSNQLVVNDVRVTSLDHWVSYFAFIYDFNFLSGLKYIEENDYINRNIDRIEYKNPDTKIKMNNIRRHAIEFINNRLKGEM